MNTSMPEWIKEWIQKDRLVRNKYKISHKYLRHKKRIQKINETKDKSGIVISFKYMVLSSKYGKYWGRENRGKDIKIIAYKSFKENSNCSKVFRIK